MAPGSVKGDPRSTYNGLSPENAIWGGVVSTTVTVDKHERLVVPVVTLTLTLVAPYAKPPLKVSSRG